MIDPKDNIPLDDADNTENAEQPSQQDIHSNGFDDIQSPDNETANNGEGDAERLQQASDASEPSFTLNTGEAKN